MKLLASLFAVASSIGAGSTWAQEAPLTAEEFQSTIVDKTVRMTIAEDGKTYELELAGGGKATVSGPYNDVGTWRVEGPGGYCINWNKQPRAEACAKFVKRAGALTILRTDGSLRATVISVK